MAQLTSDIREVIEKTAAYVAKHAELEVRIVENEKKNPLFDFLKPLHVLHPYYRERVRFYRRELGLPDDDTTPTVSKQTKPNSTGPRLTGIIEETVVEEKAKKGPSPNWRQR